MIIGKKYYFEAAHWLPGHPKCGQMHGHSYTFEVQIEGPVDERGVVIDFHELSSVVNPIVEQLDHKTLNDVLFDIEKNRVTTPSAENIALWISAQIVKALPERVKLHKLRLWETVDAWAEVS